MENIRKTYSENLEKLSTEQIVELEKKFSIVSQEISKAYLIKTQKKSIEASNNIGNFFNELRREMNSRCKDKFSILLQYARPEDKSLDLAHVGQMKAVSGKEEDFSQNLTNLEQCINPYLSWAGGLMKLDTYFKKMNNYSYSTCLVNCKSNLMQNPQLDFKELKTCLKDCSNLVTFNFNGYYNLVDRTIESAKNDIKLNISL